MTEELLRKMRRALPRVFFKKMPRIVKVVEVSRQESVRLNRKYRKKSYPANILSFRYGPEYGEIIVCPALISREAKAAGHTYRYQMTRMVLHGMIHLAGMHHEKSRVMAKKVEQLERRILDKISNV